MPKDGKSNVAGEGWGQSVQVALKDSDMIGTRARGVQGVGGHTKGVGPLSVIGK